MIPLIEQFWPIILSAFGGMVAISKFYLDWLKIKELRLKLEEAKKNHVRDSQSIVIATTEEIKKYGLQKFRSNSVTSVLLVCFVSFVFVSYQPYPSIEKSSPFRSNNSEALDFVVKAISSDQDWTYWSEVIGTEQFEKLLSESQSHIVVENESPILTRFTVIDPNHYEAEYLFEQSELIIQTKYLLVRGPNRYWFMVENIQSHNKALFQTSQ